MPPAPPAPAPPAPGRGSCPNDYCLYDVKADPIEQFEVGIVTLIVLDLAVVAATLTVTLLFGTGRSRPITQTLWHL